MASVVVVYVASSAVPKTPSGPAYRRVTVAPAMPAIENWFQRNGSLVAVAIVGFGMVLAFMPETRPDDDKPIEEETERTG